jgi:LPXTG-motif cell wall-anchored protein
MVRILLPFLLAVAGMALVGGGVSLLFFKRNKAGEGLRRWAEK